MFYFCLSLSYQYPSRDVLILSPDDIHSTLPLYILPLQLQTVLPSLYLSTVQVLELLLLFPDVNYLRVQVFVSVYSRILDLDSIHAIFDEVLILYTMYFTLCITHCETF